MDEYLICIGTQENIALVLSVLEQQIAPAFWQEQGYTVIDTQNGKAVVGKNAATGEDNLEALTTKWDEMKIAPDGRAWFYSPTNDPRFSEWKDRLPGELLALFEEIPLPEGLSVSE